MSENRKSSVQAKLATKARRTERSRKDLECGRRERAEATLRTITDHKLNYGWN